MSIEQFSYLWDGSEPGWELQHINRVEWSLEFSFSKTGPKKEDVVKLHKLLPELKSLKLSDVSRTLKNQGSYSTTERFGCIEARRICAEAYQLDLMVRKHEEQVGDYLPVSKDGHALLIEDDELANKVYKKMIEAGVKVVEILVE